MIAKKRDSSSIQIQTLKYAEQRRRKYNMKTFIFHVLGEIDFEIVIDRLRSHSPKRDTSSWGF